MNRSSATLDEVKSVLVSTLGLDDRAPSLRAETPLLGSLPELDSLAVVQLVYALEDRFGLTINDDEVSADLFETLGTLADFIENRRR
jgi:acyl carrier protein